MMKPMIVLLVLCLSFLTGARGNWEVCDECTRRLLKDDSFRDPLFIDNDEYEDVSFPQQHENKGLRGHRQLNTIDYNDVDLVRHFRMRLYWEENYCWQYECREREWCLQCQGGECTLDDYLEIDRCNKDKEQRFVYRPAEGGGGRIQPFSEPWLCWERTRVTAHQLRPCDDDEDRQVFYGFDFDQPFELHPNDMPERCMTNHHHPKGMEVIRANYCEEARKDRTSFWVADRQSNLIYGGKDYCRDTPGGCGVCHGDCDNNDECAGDLLCHSRESSEEDGVPGCLGGEHDSTGIDYCYDPNWQDRQEPTPAPSGYFAYGIRDTDVDAFDEYVKSPTMLPTEADDSTMVPADVDKQTMPPTDDNLGAAAGDGGLIFYSKHYCSPQNNGPCGMCEGDCDTDDECAGNLRCFNRTNREHVPGCGSDDGKDYPGWDYCYDPDYVDDGEDETTLSQTDNEPSSQVDLFFFSKHYCSPENDGPCGECQGDCDSDDECAGNLKCFNRTNREHVPGCGSNDGKNYPGWDYCYDPIHDGENDEEEEPTPSPSPPATPLATRETRPLVFHSNDYCKLSPSGCGLCEGDCDDDSECAGILKCTDRRNREPVPGCHGDDGQNYPGWDFCYDPNAVSQ